MILLKLMLGVVAAVIAKPTPIATVLQTASTVV
jgi:hypothetical protein